MHTAKTSATIGWVRALPKLAPDDQRKRLLDHGIEERDIVQDGALLRSGRRQDWAWLMRRLRAGDTLAVSKLRAIYAPLPNLSVRKALFKRLHDIEEHSVDLVEVATGRRSTVQRERDCMIVDCLDELARAAQGRDGGRPKLALSPAEIAVVERHWPSHKHATNLAAVQAIRAEAQAAGMRELLRLRSVQAYINRFGASGRGGRRTNGK